MNEIANGKHVGRVADVTVTTSKAGNHMVVIEWRIDGGLRRRSFHVTENAEGVRLPLYERTVGKLKALFPGWDGGSTDWFVEHYDECLDTAAQLTVLNKEWNGRLSASIEDVRPLPSGEEVRGGVPPPPKRAVKCRGLLPDVIEPTLESVWSAYVGLHAEEDYKALEAGWFALLDRTVVPQKDQDTYDEFEWNLVIAALREEAASAEEKEVL